MKRKLITVLTGSSGMQYAIRVDKLANGREKYQPMVKENGWFANWIPIVKVDGKYMAIHLETDFEHTLDTAKEYISAYKREVERKESDRLVDVTYIKM